MTDADTTIFHNPRCSKSRQALAVIEQRGAPHTVVEYLKTPPDRSTLESIVARLDDPPAELVRTDDAGFAGLGVDPATLSSPAVVVDILCEHPELMQRPLVMHGDRVVIGRPTERVAELFG
ncbi:MAG: arsenate reductase (glutaredoxin) [Acidimicrobiales bacterium]